MAQIWERIDVLINVHSAAAFIIITPLEWGGFLGGRAMVGISFSFLLLTRLGAGI